MEELGNSELESMSVRRQAGLDPAAAVLRLLQGLKRLASWQHSAPADHVGPPT